MPKWGYKRVVEAHHDESICQTLHPEPDGSVAHVAPLRLHHWVKVNVDHAVEVSRHHLSHLRNGGRGGEARREGGRES